MSKIMSINAGSSSLKFQLLNMPEETVITKGIVERIGLDDSIFSMSLNGEKIKIVQNIKDHSEAVKLLLNKLKEYSVVKEFDEIVGIAHRVVHGGERFVDSVIINEDVIGHIEEMSDLAPLHNPVNIVGIRAFKEALPAAVAVAVFDTAFHQTMKPEAFIYPTPYVWYEKYGVRRYGFHGTSHKYVAERAAVLIGKPKEELNIISAHIGNGVSLCAIEKGKSVDTTMGMTPLAGIAMGTRSGDIDPAIIEFIGEKESLTVKEVINKLNKESGLLGISGISSDGRDIERGIKEGNERCILAHRVQAKRITYFVAAYFTYMGGADGIVFTAGIGENDALMRQSVCDGLKALGVEIDYDLNNRTRDEATISTDASSIKVMVIPTNEELMMAKDTYRLLNQ